MKLQHFSSPRPWIFESQVSTKKAMLSFLGVKNGPIPSEFSETKANSQCKKISQDTTQTQEELEKVTQNKGHRCVPVS